jgi:hypothetical protein
MIKNACPYPPGERKPKTMPPPIAGNGQMKNLYTLKNLIIILCFLTLILIYTQNYHMLDQSNKPVLFQDWYTIKMSIYTYTSIMLTHFIRQHKRKQKERTNK